MNLQIVFYSEAEASVRLEPEGSHPDQWELFARFALQQFSFQGKQPPSEALARRLIDLPDEPVFQGSPKLTFTGGPPKKVGLEGWPSLVPFRGKGAKRFDCRLSNGRLSLKHSGFGLFSADLIHYANFSVLAFYRYLYETHRGDRAYAFALRAVAGACGQLRLDGEITSKNHEELARGMLGGLFRTLETYAGGGMEPGDPLGG